MKQDFIGSINHSADGINGHDMLHCVQSAFDQMNRWLNNIGEIGFSAQVWDGSYAKVLPPTFSIELQSIDLTVIRDIGVNRMDNCHKIKLTVTWNPVSA